MTCSPLLAIWTLQHAADDEQITHTEVVQIIKRDFYVDNLFTGADDLEELIYLQAKLNIVLSRAGFHLRRWTVNHLGLLDSMPPEDPEIQQRWILHWLRNSLASNTG